MEAPRASGTPGEGLKRAILNTVAQEVQNLSLSRTLDTALSFFERFDIGVAKINNIRNDRSIVNPKRKPSSCLATKRLF